MRLIKRHPERPITADDLRRLRRRQEHADFAIAALVVVNIGLYTGWITGWWWPG